MDKRKNNGGVREGAGRKPKAEELSLVKLGKDAVIDVYGSEEEYWKHIARESKDSLPHLKMLSEYIYGKPKESKSIEITEIPVIDMGEWK
tara:strand:+ start:337 stop:606 length:270 start_codon:yes stop_codon:yes gene_type:complete